MPVQPVHHRAMPKARTSARGVPKRTRPDTRPRRFIRDPNYHGCVNELPRNDKRIPRFLAQRRKRGFDDSETWGLDHAILRYTLPRLKRFCELTCGHPTALTMEQWEGLLDEMVAGITLYLDDDATNREGDAKVRRGLKLFAQWLPHLWW